MSGAVVSRRQFGEGPLSRAAALVYTLMVVEALLLVTVAPGLVALVLLGRDASNLPLAALCAVPVGPAVAAALYALRYRRADVTDLHPGAAYRRGLRVNLGSSLRIWLPLLAWLTIVAVNVTHLGAGGVPGWWRVPLLVIAAAVTLLGVNALVISSLFAFRTRDVARLAAYFLVRTPGVTLGNAGVLLAAALVTLLFSEAVLALLGAVFVLVLLSTSGPMITRVAREFTVPADDA